MDNREQISILLQEIKQAFSPHTNSAKGLFHEYFTFFFKHNYLIEEFKKFCEDYNKLNYGKIKFTTNLEDFIDDVFSDADHNKKNPISKRAEDIKNDFILKKQDDKYHYLEFLLQNDKKFRID